MEHRNCIFRFADVEVDESNFSVTKAGELLPVEPKVFKVLQFLVHHPDRVVTKDELLDAVWSDTSVSESSLTRSVAMLRRLLGDDIREPRFIATVPTVGYRFLCEVHVSENGYIPAGASDAITEPPPKTSIPPKETPRSHWSSGLVIVAACCAFVLLAGAGWFVYQRSRPKNSPPVQRALVRLSFDEGLQTGATWSPDSRFIAYSSNRGGKFDIWVQQVSGGDPVQITRQPGQNWQPDWSPDGRYIAYRSEGGEGGLFIVPALGGAGMERKIASFGFYPRWSPDSSQILFQTTQFGWLNRFYVANLEGAPPREVLTQLASNCNVLAMSAAWHPDGKRISALINSDPIPTFWTGSVSGGAPVKSEISPELLQQIEEVAAVKSGVGRVTEHEWVLDFKFSWAPSGRAIYFERTFRGARNIWRMTVDPQTLRAISIERVTTGPGHDTEFSLSPDGKRLAFTDQSHHVRAWLFPFDATQGRVTALGRPITSSGVEAWLHNLSPDGKRLAFSSARSGRWVLTESPLPDGPETPVVSDDSDLRYDAQWSPDSTRLAYVRVNHSTGVMQFMEWSSRSRNEEPLAPPTHALLKISDWSRKSNSLLISQTNQDTGREEIAVLPLADMPRGSAVARSLLSDAAYDLYQARFSPDERWIVFEAIPKYNNQPSASEIYVSPASGGSWIRITDGKRWDDKPHWSPDGKIIYFLSARSGFFNVWAKHFDPLRGEPLGDPFPVTALDSPSQMVSKFIPTIALSLTQDRLVLTVAQDSGNIWVLDNVDR